MSEVTLDVLACPFCGLVDAVEVLGDPLLAAEFDIDADAAIAFGARSFAVLCNANKGGCGGAGRFCLSAELAVKAWNTRDGEPMRTEPNHVEPDDPIYSRKYVDAAVAAERERIIKLCEAIRDERGALADFASDPWVKRSATYISFGANHIAAVLRNEKKA